MGKIIPTVQKRWDSGMQNDIRSNKPNGVRLVKNADILTYPSKVKPYNSSESGNDTVARELTTFLYANATLYGLGVMTGTTKPKIFTKMEISLKILYLHVLSVPQKVDFLKQDQLFY